ncbi:MAG: site-specific DNA-methyltransferase [Campylobacter sp.]|uniref:DNA-methyltransferase n=1 Tax=Campylobacter concisus TaxID=199 RepID=UPI000D2F8041|nr:site-specific DNA-methyltransferase [Campylobacter concisus]MDO4874993.1 site-specific DNA-methyltransferase [Campylobacter sp.]
MVTSIINKDVYKFLKTLKSESINLIITSPPYNIGKEYETKVSIEKYLNIQKEIISELVRVLRNDGSIAWEVGNFVSNKEVFPLDFYYYEIFKELGLKLRNRIIWRFGHGLHASLRFSGRYETILWFSKSDKYTFNLDNVRVAAKYPGKRHFKGDKKGQLSGNPKGKNPSDIWDIVINDWDKEIWDIVNVKSNHVEKTLHPCQFPVELVDRLILALSNEGDVVLDPFGGVGSTLISAVKNNRIGISVDKEKEYCKIAEQRLEKLKNGNLKLREAGQQIYVPKNDSIAKIPQEWRGQGAYQ